MIQSFADKLTQALFQRRPIKRLDSKIQRVALRKLVMLDAATALEDLLRLARRQRPRRADRRLP